MQTKFFPASERGIKNIGWLRSNFIFSFSDYNAPDKSSFGTLFAFNDDFVQTGKGFGIHPHMNMEIISVILQGSMNHKDSMGYSNVVQEDWVQIMSGGSGLFHEEYNVGDNEVNFLQIWILPKQQNIRPRYQFRYFPKQERKNMVKTIISSEEGQDHCWINQNSKLSLGYFDKDHSINYSFNSVNKCLFIFAINKGLTISGIHLSKRDAIGVWNTNEVKIDVEQGSEFLIIETPVNQK